MPLVAQRIALIGPHHADPLEARLLVAADRSRVLSSRVDRDPMVASLLNQMVDRAAEHLGAEPAAVARRVEKQVDRGVAVARLALLLELDQSRDLTIDLDGPPGGVGVIPGELVVGFRPPAANLLGAVDPLELARVGRDERAEDERVREPG